MPLPPQKISLTNLADGDILTYPLAIICGHLTPSPTSSQIHISTSTSSSHSTFPVISSKFIALYELQPGSNKVLLASDPSLLSTPSAFSLTIFYTPPAPSRPFIRLVYLLTSDSDGSFHSPDSRPANNVLSGIRRLQTAGYMIQSATAEMMHGQGFQRRTFALDKQVRVHRLRDLKTEQAKKLSDMELWSHIAHALRDLPDRERSIDVAVMSFTAMENGKVKAHTALGGGKLALFGGGSLFTWPVDVGEIAMRLSDSRGFDPKIYFDDSAGRMRVSGRRACCSTTIGALLHELGHCLSLPHPTGKMGAGGGGIMARGFDDLDRLFFQKQGGGACAAFWDRGSAVRLRYHEYLGFEGEREMRRLSRMALETGEGSKEEAPMFVKIGGDVICKSAVGIGHIGYYKNGDNAGHEEFKEGKEPREFCLLSEMDIRKKYGMRNGDKLVVSVIDVEGKILDELYDAIVES